MINQREKEVRKHSGADKLAEICDTMYFVFCVKFSESAADMKSRVLRP